MLRYLVLVVLLTSSSTWAMRSPLKGGSNGCGLGWFVNKQKSLIGSSTRGTTNATLPGPFGYTSGTCGCDAHSIAEVDFLEVHYEELMVALARGEGEEVRTLSALLGCDARELGPTLKTHYPRLGWEGRDPHRLLHGILFHLGGLNCGPLVSVSTPSGA